MLTALACISFVLSPAQSRKGDIRLAKGSDSHRLYVSVLSDVPEGILDEALAEAVPGFGQLTQSYGIVPERAIVLSTEKREEFSRLAIQNTGSAASITKLGNIFHLSIDNPDNDRLLELALALEKLDNVEYCSLIPAQPVEPPFDIMPVTPVFTNQQTYLGQQGVEMDYAWNMGLNGQGIKLRDIEYGFNKNHEELNDINAFLAPGTTVSNQVSVDFAEHGTAVFGVMYAHNGGYGITGMAHGADEMLLFPEYQQSGYNRVLAVTQAFNASTEGDIIVYEMQMPGAQGQYGPAEFDNVIWDLTKAASDAGIIVVAAAGNGAENLDGDEYFSYRQRGDSGAIIVGAGVNNSSRNRLDFSTFGSRVDVQGWGTGVFTSGYGDAEIIGGDFNQRYTYFGGTSSATPIVASCAAVLLSYYHSLTGNYMTGPEMRELLKQTGKQQGISVWGNIGPLPSMQNAISAIDDMLSTGKTEEGLSFTAYPNPVEDSFTLSGAALTAGARAEVYNSLGQIVHTSAVSDGSTINVSNLAKGVYIVTILSEGRISTKRIVKK